MSPSSGLRPRRLSAGPELNPRARRGGATAAVGCRRDRSNRRAVRGRPLRVRRARRVEPLCGARAWFRVAPRAAGVTRRFRRCRGQAVPEGCVDRSGRAVLDRRLGGWPPRPRPLSAEVRPHLRASWLVGAVGSSERLARRSGWLVGAVGSRCPPGAAPRLTGSRRRRRHRRVCLPAASPRATSHRPARRFGPAAS